MAETLTKIPEEVANIVATGEQTPAFVLGESGTVYSNETAANGEIGSRIGSPIIGPPEFNSSMNDE